jgi:hypothetical protein
MSKTDIRQRSDRELRLIVMNTESLYLMAHNPSISIESITDLIGDLYLYTAEQMADLVETIEADRAEGAN